MKRIRSGRGLGDNLYLQSIVRHLVSKGVDLQVCTDFPEIFDFPVKFDEFSRHNINILSHYTKRKSDQRTNQWEDICLEAGFQAELKIDWKLKNKKWLDLPRPFCFVHGGREPMDRKDKFGRELLPCRWVFYRCLERIKEKYTAVCIGKGKILYDLDTDIKLNNKTSVSDILDIASLADVFLGQCSFIIPLAESFDKKLLVVWSHRGLKSSERYISTITPKKILSKPTSHFVMDDWNEKRINEKLDQFLVAQP